jgi:transposase
MGYKAIAETCRMPRTTVRRYCTRASQTGITGFGMIEAWSDSQLEAHLFTAAPAEAAPEPSLSAKAPRTFPLPDWNHVHQELKRPGVTRVLLWKEYRAAHPDGYRYTQFTQLYKHWLEHNVEPRMRRHHQPGDALEVDYAGMTLTIGRGRTAREASVFVACLPYSTYLFAEATWTQQAEDWLSSHVRLFTHLCGVPAKLVPDNLKTGITHACFFDPVVNRSYLDLAQHYQVAVVPARTRKPRDKAHAENGVQQVERRVLAPLRNRVFLSLEEANRAIAEQLALVNGEPLSLNPQTSRQALFEAEERLALRPLPSSPFVIGRWLRLKVPPDYHVTVGQVAYSVPYRLIGQSVDIHLTPTLVGIFHDGLRIAAHVRQEPASGKGRPGPAVTLDEHRPARHRKALQMTPEALQEAAQALGAMTGRFVDGLFAGADHPDQAVRSSQGVLKLAQLYGPALLEAACAAALSANVISYRYLEALLRQGEIPQPEPAGGAGHHRHVRGSGYYH